MLLNILLGFILPWIVFGTYFYRKTPRILLTIFPIGAVLAHIINILGIHYKLWEIIPDKVMNVDAFLFDTGLYAILAVGLIYFISRNNKKVVWVIIIIFAAGTTILEYFWLLQGRVSYYNGWNIYLTFFSYLFPYILIYLYYLLLRKNNLI